MAQSRRQKTEQKILKAALSLIVRKGYNGTSIDEITKAAELTKGALYGHCESKAHLVKLCDMIAGASNIAMNHVNWSAEQHHANWTDEVSHV